MLKRSPSRHSAQSVLVLTTAPFCRYYLSLFGPHPNPWRTQAPGPIAIVRSTIAKDGFIGLYSGCGALVTGNAIKVSLTCRRAVVLQPAGHTWQRKDEPWGSFRLEVVPC